MADTKLRDLARLIDALTRNGSDNPVTNHALVACTEVIATNLAAIHEQLRIANLIALAAEGWTTSDRIADSAWAALEALTEPDPDSTKPRNQLRPRIAAALGIPQEGQP